MAIEIARAMGAEVTVFTPPQKKLAEAVKRSVSRHNSGPDIQMIPIPKDQ